MTKIIIIPPLQKIMKPSTINIDARARISHNAFPLLYQQTRTQNKYSTKPIMALKKQHKHKHIFLTGSPTVGKTTIIKHLQTIIERDSLASVKGFYTEECRSSTGGGGRSGFDIVYWNSYKYEKYESDSNSNIDNAVVNSNGDQETETESTSRRAELSRIKDHIKNSDPHVGKYLVNIDNVEKYIVASIDATLTGAHTSTSSLASSSNELVIIDEVGKMEMLCPQFLPSVRNLLDDDACTDTTTRIDNSKRRLIIGTIPTPRYGRVIQAIEDIRARDDVIVLHVTKANRDHLRDVLQSTLERFFSNKTSNEQSIENENKHENEHDDEHDDENENEHENDDAQRQHCAHNYPDLVPFIYTRPIGASSLKGDCVKKVARKPVVEGTPSTESSSTLIPCGPLVSTNVKPKVLILGETASPQTANAKHAYNERSMWVVFGRMLGMDYKPIKRKRKNIDGSSDDDDDNLQKYMNLQEKVLSKGICIWDVLANVHEKGGTKKRRRKSSSSDSDQKLNDIEDFLKQHPSIEMIGFIGIKARKKFESSVTNCSLFANGQKLKLKTLHSSSPANTRSTIAEKAAQWKMAMSNYVEL